MLVLRREITINGKIYQIDVGQCLIGSPFTLKVNDKTVEVVLEQEPNYAKGFSIIVNRKSYYVEMPSMERNTPFSVKVNDVPFKIELKSAISTPKVAITAPSLVSVQVQRPTKALGEGVVAAPMAGRIISIKVKKGDSVKIGSVLCVLEAMKMENEITAPKGGDIDEIKVQEGKAVNEGDILMLIK